MSAARDVVINARLKFTDLASTAIGSLRDSLRSTNKELEEGQEAGNEFFDNFFERANAVRDFFAPMVEQVRTFGAELVDAARGGQADDQALGGWMAAVQGAPIQDMIDGAGALNDELDKVAIHAGVAGDAIAAAFTRMIEVRGATEHGLSTARDQIEDIAMISGVMNKNVAGLANEFVMAEEGMIRTKGQLFQLLKPTGIFNENTRQASQEWSKLTEESRAELLAYGLSKVAKTMKEVPPTFNQTMIAFDNAVDTMKEAFGGPLLDAIQPRVEKWTKRFFEEREHLISFAERLAPVLEEWGDDLEDTVERSVDYLRDHGDEIWSKIKEAFATGKEVVDYILEHKEEIAVLYGAHAASPHLKAGYEAAGRLGGVFAGGLGQFEGTGGGARAQAGAFLAFGAAVTSFALAVDQWQSIMDETQGGMSEGERDQDARKRYFEDMIKSDKTGTEAMGSAWFDDVRAAYVRSAEELGGNSREAGELADKAWEHYRQVRRMVEPTEKAVAAMDEFTKNVQAAGDYQPTEEDFAIQEQLVARVSEGFKAAMSAHHDGAMQQVATLLAGSRATQQAFLMSADLTAEGFGALADLVGDNATDFRDKLKELAESAAAKDSKKEAPLPAKVFIGQANFTLYQYFDDDPDNVAIAFHRDVVQAAEARRAPRVGRP